MAAYPIDQLLILDVETVSQYPSYEAMPGHWKDLWAEKIRTQLPEEDTPESFYPKRAAILAEFGRIICISAGYFARQPDGLQFRIKSFSGESEVEILSQFSSSCSQVSKIKKGIIFCGHNIREFDIPYISRRMLVNRVAIPDFFNFQAMKPWEANLVDTMQLWRFGDYKNYTSLNLLAACLGVPSPKTDLDGSMVGEVYWHQNNLERIVQYCQQDVLTVAQVMLRFSGMELLEPERVVVAG
jgi:DNA polymerase elongation subunit (family B)